MLEQIVGVAALVVVGVWVIAMIVTQIQYLIASFRASVGLTILAMIVPFVGLYVLIKFWEDLKKPFFTQLVVAFGGVTLLMLGGLAIQAMGVAVGLPQALRPETATDSTPAKPPAIQEIKTLEPRPAVQSRPAIQPQPVVKIPRPDTPDTPATPAEQPATPAEQPATPAVQSPLGIEVPIRDTASITVPQGWVHMPWKLPNLAVAMGDAERGEFVTVQSFDNTADLSFEEFQGGAIGVVLGHLIEGTPPTEFQHQRVSGCEVATFAMGGHGRLPDQAGQGMSARVSCINGTLNRHIIVQWRTSAWDAQSAQTFNRLLNSFAEVGGE